MTPPAEGSYLYCIGRAGQKGLEMAGLQGQAVRLVSSEGLAAFVSDHPVVKVPITREHAIIHQKVMEEAMRGGTVLPVRFSTIAQAKEGRTADERLAEKVLAARREELGGLLEGMRGKVELGVKATWTDMRAVFQEIAAEDPAVRRLRAGLARKSGGTQQDKVALGEAVRKALLAKKKAEGDRLLEVLGPMAEDCRLNKPFGDSMLLNTAFLVRSDREKEFDLGVQELSRSIAGRMRLRYAGPLPICNFVEISVSW